MELFRSICLLLLHLPLLLSSTATTRATASTGHGGDEGALLAFKANISRHSGLLDSWNQSISYCSWEGVTCGKRHPWRVVALDLSSRGLDGTISSAIGSLTFLRSLNLSANTLQGEIPPSIGSLGHLQRIDLSTNMLTGVIPSNITRCTSLRVMDMDSNKGLQGSIPAEIGNLQSLTYLVLSNNNISGTIPSSLGKLSRLTIVDLSNNYLEGSIPAEIGNLQSLTYLALSNNSIAGTIPSSLGNLSRLTILDLSDNYLEGSILADIGNLHSLTYLVLSSNSIAGTIPSSLGNLSRLNTLALSGNHLEGSIPAGIGNNPYLGFLQLSSNNLSGLLPPSLFNLSSLYYFFVAHNNLHGRLPADLGKSLSSIQSIGFRKNLLFGTLPLSLGNLTTLQDLLLEMNNFTGTVPSELGRLQNLQKFVLDINDFEANNEQEWGFISSLTNCSRLQILTIGWNRFAGKLPCSVANFSANLQWLRTPINTISGNIPSEIGNLAGLQTLDFRGNLLSGDIPESIGKLTQLTELYLYSNNISGVIPFTVGNITGLSIPDAHDNNLEGPIPLSIGNLSKLSTLDLSSNKLTGFIPKEILELSPISIYLSLSYNLLEGSLPVQVGNLVNLKQLSISGNNLSGEIPDTIGNCGVMEILLMDGNSFQSSIPATLKNMAGLTLLNLTNNKLNGTIPGNLGSLTNLQELYLSHNNLLGSIPQLLGNSTSLLHLDLSFNNLQGDVPVEEVFKNLTGLSIVGNSKLCGGVPQLRLPRCPNSTIRGEKKKMPKSLKIAIPTIGALLLLLFLVWARFHYRKSKTEPNQAIPPPQLTEKELPMVPYNDILKGTNGFSEANVLGKGRYGTVYKGTLENQAIVVAVKVFNLQLSGSYKSFQAECEALRRVKHRCLVKIITCCSSINHQGQDFRALVFELMPNGSLDRWVHSNFEGQNGQVALTLSQRLDIAVDIVDALDYLHNGSQPPIIHCDLKPSNILLNQDMRARVGDFGIARVLDEATSKHHVNSSSTIGIRGSIGYIAPEYGEGLSVSTSGDVFSLGITLIEMFTGKSPTDDMFRDGMSLHYYAKAALPHKIMEIVDSNIWLHDGVNNNNDTGHITRNMECLSAVIKLGVLCSKQLPTERLSMNDAAAEMHSIRDKYIFTQ